MNNNNDLHVISEDDDVDELLADASQKSNDAEGEAQTIDKGTKEMDSDEPFNSGSESADDIVNSDKKVDTAPEEKTKKIKYYNKKRKLNKLSKKSIIVVIVILTLSISIPLAIYNGFSVSALFDSDDVSLFSFTDKKAIAEIEKTKLTITKEQEAIKNIVSDMQGEMDNYSKVEGDLTGTNQNVAILQNLVTELNGKSVVYERAINVLSERLNAVESMAFNQPKVNTFDPSKLESQQLKLAKQNITNRANFKKLWEWQEKIDKKMDAYVARMQALPTVDVNSKRVTLDVNSPWVLTGISKDRAIIRNIRTKEPLRLMIGVDVPHCGPVIRINAQQGYVDTQSCKKIGFSK